MDIRKYIVDNIDRLHTTSLGVTRIKRNLSLTSDDVINFCKGIILANDTTFSQQGKNFYVETESVIITINAHSLTIITAHIR